MSTDTTLRIAGFAIVERKKDSPAVWRRAGKTFLEAVAPRIATREAAEKAILAGGVRV